MTTESSFSTGKKIAVLRALNGLSQTDLAREIGLTQAQISRLESGASRKPSYDAIRRISNHFGINPVDLDDGTPLPQNISSDAEEPPLSLKIAPEAHPTHHLIVGKPGSSRRSRMAALAETFDDVVVFDSSGEWTSMLEDAGMEVNHAPVSSLRIGSNPEAGDPFYSDIMHIKSRVGQMTKRAGMDPFDLVGAGWTVVDLMNKDESVSFNKRAAALMVLDLLTNEKGMTGDVAVVVDEADMLIKSTVFLDLVKHAGKMRGLYLIAGMFRSAPALPPETQWTLLETFGEIHVGEIPGRELPFTHMPDLDFSHIPDRFEFHPGRERGDFSGWWE